MNGDTSMVASEMGNFLLLYRSLLDWKLYSDINCRLVMLHLLLKASWKGGRVMYRGSWIDIQPGDVATTLNDLEKEVGITKSQVRTALEHMTKEGTISARCIAHRLQVISLLQWPLYQKCINVESHGEKHGDRTVVARWSHGDRTQIEEGKEREEGKEQKKKTPPKSPKGDIGVVIPVELDTPEFREAWEDWVQHRREIGHKLTPRSINTQMKAMREWGVDRSVKAIRHTIFKGWQGLSEPSPQPTLPGINGNGQKRELTWEERHAARKEQYGS